VIIRHHNEESWVELFIDLTYVALFITLGLSIAECDISPNLLSHAALIFLIMFFFRLSVDNYSNRFFSEDVMTRILYFCYAYGIALMIMNINAEAGSCPHMGLDTKGFLVGYVGARLSIILMYVIALWTNRHTVPQFCLDLIVSLLILSVSLAMFYPGANRPLFYKISLSLEFVMLTPVLGNYIRPYFAKLIGCVPANDVYYVVPLNIIVYQRRLCMFIMMVLGEGVIQILEPTLDSNHLERCYLYATCGLILIFSFAMQYCDAVLREHVEHHALRRSSAAGRVWIFMHPVLAYFMYLVGISIKLSYHDVTADHQIFHEHDVVLGVSCGAVVLCLTLMRSTHKGVFRFDAEAKEETQRKNIRRVFNYSVRLLVVFLHWMAAWKSFNVESHATTARDRFLYFHCALSALSVVFEVILSQFSNAERDPSPDTISKDSEVGARTRASSAISINVDDNSNPILRDSEL